VHQHHVVYRQHVRGAHGDEWDSDNALSLCLAHHGAHHARTNVLAISVLRPENVAFAEALLGKEAAHVYLARYYDGDGTGWLTKPGARHATITGYMSGCRCADCRKARTEYSHRGKTS